MPWIFATAYAPPDTTPLHRVEVSISNVSTTWIYHRAMSKWKGPVMTIVTSDGGSICFTAHSKDESPAVLSLANLQKGSALCAQVDASGEIRELSANEKEVVPLADTLARHHKLAFNRNIDCGFLLLLGVGLGVLDSSACRVRATSDKGRRRRCLRLLSPNAFCARRPSEGWDPVPDFIFLGSKAELD